MPDFNLLIALDALLAEASVARAAQRLQLSPSAMSRTLTRLREATGDPLLVRAGRRLVPTAARPRPCTSKCANSSRMGKPCCARRPRSTSRASPEPSPYAPAKLRRNLRACPHRPDRRRSARRAAALHREIR
ncbi:helix-turn-helix domain-containing protein [Elstera litoralis]|uniref:helix-turn-helix domain-containing protein n=1 Tax=Elstera litoralis TaxID=552518 RepID=UPI002FC39C3F